MRQVYGISFNGKWAIRFNLPDAREMAIANHGTVRSLSLRLWHDCGNSMDWPTFYAQSKFVMAYA